MEKTMNYLENYKKLVSSRVTPTPREYEEVTVEFNIDAQSMLAEYSNIEYAALEGKIDLQGGEIPFSREEFFNFVKTLVYSRVAWVNNMRYVVHPNEPIAVPAFLSTVLMNIGNAEENSLGLRLVPVISGTSNDDGMWLPFEENFSNLSLLNLYDMRRISNFLKSIGGYNYGKGYLKDKSGVFDFMSMQLVENYVVRHNSEAHPVYALMASILQPHLVTSALSPLVKYANVEFLSGLLWEVTAV